MINQHSIICDVGTLSMVRAAQNISADIKRGFDRSAARTLAFKELEAKKRKKALKENVRILQQQNKSESVSSAFATELSQYVPPLNPITDDVVEGSPPPSSPTASSSAPPVGTAAGSSSNNLPRILLEMSHEESETLKCITNHFREGMSITQLISIAKAAKESKEEKEAMNARKHRLIEALKLDEDDFVVRNHLKSILDAKELDIALEKGWNKDKTSRDGRMDERSSSAFLSSDESAVLPESPMSLRKNPTREEMRNEETLRQGDDMDSDGDSDDSLDPQLVFAFLKEKPSRNVSKTGGPPRKR